MAPQTLSSKPVPEKVSKLPPIPAGAKIQKRPLTRPQQPASSKSSIIYVSSSTPFMSAVKRVSKQLNASLRTATAAPRGVSLDSRIKALQRSSTGNDSSRNTSRGGDGRGVMGATGAGNRPAVVEVMGTGRAVEKTLKLASWFEQRGDCVVEVRTDTVATVDDVVPEDEDELEESRVRKLSCLKVSVRLR